MKNIQSNRSKSRQDKIRYTIASLGMSISGFLLFSYSMGVTCCWKNEFILSVIFGLGLLFGGLIISYIGAVSTLSSYPKRRGVLI